jgi:hypothetical protein
VEIISKSERNYLISTLSHKLGLSLIDAEDIVQNTQIALYKSNKHLPPGYNRLSWLNRWTFNQAKGFRWGNIKWKNGLKKALELDLLRQQDNKQNSMEENLIKKDLVIKWDGVINTDPAIVKNKKRPGSSGTEVLCITTGEIFPTIKKAATAYNLDPSGLAAHLRGYQKSAGKSLSDDALLWKKL